MKIRYDAGPRPYPEQRGRWAKTAFLDPGGSVDRAALTVCRTDLFERIIYVVGAMFWRISEADNVLFATIRNDIAKLHAIHRFDYVGAETNNYGRSEIESLRREYGIRVVGITTVGKLTDKRKMRSGLAMEKEAIIKFTNSWRQNAIVDPENRMRLGQIKFVRRKTPELRELLAELDSFVRKDPEGIGATGRPKFGAEGSTQHDDGPLSMLGNFHLIRHRVLRLGTGQGGGESAVAVAPNEDRQAVQPQPGTGGRGATGFVDHKYDY